jgi:hypothetical protein
MRSNNLVELAKAVHVEVLEDCAGHLQRHTAVGNLLLATLA